jgi:hypothetical protein
MDRWTRRWKAGEEAKDQLKVILDDVSSPLDWPKGSVEQLIGDYYGFCMVDPRLIQAGTGGGGADAHGQFVGCRETPRRLRREHRRSSNEESFSRLSQRSSS